VLAVRKSDVDLKRQLMRVGRSWDRETTKGGHLQRNPEVAARFSEGVLAAIDMLASTPVDGPVYRLATGEECRSWPVPPVRLFYSRAGDTLTVLRIYHHARTPIAGPP
jgi:plasmid stabilization system protein ParE